MKYKAFVELEVALGPVEPTHREEYKIFEGLANAMNHAIADEIPYHEALEGVAVVKVRIPTTELTAEETEPAAAGEGGGTGRFPLSGDQVESAERILQQDFVTPIQAYDLQVKTAPPTLTGVVYTSGQPHLISHQLTQEEVLIILGELVH